jgi:uncharacterized protein YfaT (DUF1175 family)
MDEIATLRTLLDAKLNKEDPKWDEINDYVRKYDPTELDAKDKKWDLMKRYVRLIDALTPKEAEALPPPIR